MRCNWALYADSSLWSVDGLPQELSTEAISRLDLNGDKRSDVFARNKSTGAWTGYLMNGAVVENSAELPLTKNLLWSFQGAGDFDGNGSEDILLRRSDNGSWFIYLMDGLTVLDQGTPLSVAANPAWDFMAVEDFNGDEKDDILLRRAQTGSWFIYAMDGLSPIDGGDTGAARITTNRNWQFAGARDFNGDGSADVLLRRSDGPWYMHPMQGLNHLLGSDFGLVSMTSNTAWSLQKVADSTGDGFPEVLLRHTSGKWFSYSMQGKSKLDSDTGMIGLPNDLAWELVKH